MPMLAKRIPTAPTNNFVHLMWKARVSHQSPLFWRQVRYDIVTSAFIHNYDIVTSALIHNASFAIQTPVEEHDDEWEHN